jgi:hypothetical protein
MAALALPFDQVMPIVREAEAQTRRVVVCSKARLATWNRVAVSASKTIALKFKFANLVHTQEDLIAKLVDFDFSAVPEDRIKHVAGCIDELIANEKDLLRDANKLGIELRVWWNTSLVRLAQQVEHLDSISESLHLEFDEQAPILMAAAIEQFSRA